MVFWNAMLHFLLSVFQEWTYVLYWHGFGVEGVEGVEAVAGAFVNCTRRFGTSTRILLEL